MTATLLTPDGSERFNGEYAGLLRVREGLVAHVRAALEAGGPFPENGEYLDAKHELDMLERRLAVLEERLVDGQVVEASRDGELELGERVTVLDLVSGETFDYRVVGSGEGEPHVGTVSYKSPIGAALLGRRVGDVVEADAPGGRRRLEIVELDG